MSAKLKDGSPSDRRVNREARVEQEFLVPVCLFAEKLCLERGIAVADRNQAKTYEFRTQDFTFQLEKSVLRGSSLRIWFHPNRPYDARMAPVLYRWWHLSPERGHTMSPLSSSSLWRERIADLMEGKELAALPEPPPKPTPEPPKAVKTSVRLLDPRIKVHVHPTLPKSIEGLQLTQGMRLKKGDLVARDDGWQEISPHLVGLRVDLNSPTPSYFVRPVTT